MPVKSYKKPELKEAEDLKPLQKSPYKQEIGKHFDYTMDFEFLDVVAKIIDRIDFNVKNISDDSTEDEEDFYEAIDQSINDSLVSIADRWTILEFYVDSPEDLDSYSWINSLSELTDDIYSIIREIKGEERESDDIEYEDEEEVEEEDEE